MNAALEAHLRLQTSLPVRTHEARPALEVVVKSMKNRRHYQRRTEIRQGKTSPVVVGKQTFDSVTQAIRLLRVSPKTFYQMIDSGLARFLEASTGTQNASGKSVRQGSLLRVRTGKS